MTGTGVLLPRRYPELEYSETGVEPRRDSPHDDRLELVEANLECDVDDGMSLE